MQAPVVVMSEYPKPVELARIGTAESLPGFCERATRTDEVMIANADVSLQTPVPVIGRWEERHSCPTLLRPRRT